MHGHHDLVSVPALRGTVDVNRVALRVPHESRPRHGRAGIRRAAVVVAVTVLSVVSEGVMAVAARALCRRRSEEGAGGHVVVTRVGRRPGAVSLHGDPAPVPHGASGTLADVHRVSGAVADVAGLAKVVVAGLDEIVVVLLHVAPVDKVLLLLTVLFPAVIAGAAQSNAPEVPAGHVNVPRDVGRVVGELVGRGRRSAAWRLAVGGCDFVVVRTGGRSEIRKRRNCRLSAVRLLLQIISDVAQCSPRHRLYGKKVGGSLRPSRRLRGLAGDAFAAEDNGHDDCDGEDEAAEDAREYYQKRHRCWKRMNEACHELRSICVVVQMFIPFDVMRNDVARACRTRSLKVGYVDRTPIFSHATSERKAKPYALSELRARAGSAGITSRFQRLVTNLGRNYLACTHCLKSTYFHRPSTLIFHHR